MGGSDSFAFLDQPALIVSSPREKLKPDKVKPLYSNPVLSNTA